ncbi:hypothetical protein NC653_026923 [Populus alba x Populus x berolinensis]|uniref:Uncharacterized protein n=1 Tax=Populus alba x Populus x berolinensis TaxID=444605 RepID=A0AAD6M479_9ROSI|nr:hypothetical protein NC653_026923 [Populus alba x Populus x berolinensis]
MNYKERVLLFSYLSYIGTLNYLSLAECKMLQTLLELPFNLVGLDVSYCYSLQRIANLIPFTIARDCDQLVHIQDLIKLELIQKVDSHLLRIMEMVSVQMQTWRFQIELQGNRFNVVLEYDENEMLEFYVEEGLIQKEFEEHMSFKISSPATHRICGFNLFTWFSATPVSNPISAEKSELLWLSYWKFGSNDPAFDNGDEFSVSVFTDDLVAQIKRVGVRMLHEEEGTDDDSSSSNSSDDASMTAPLAPLSSMVAAKLISSSTKMATKVKVGGCHQQASFDNVNIIDNIPTTCLLEEEIGLKYMWLPIVSNAPATSYVPLSQILYMVVHANYQGHLTHS